MSNTSSPPPNAPTRAPGKEPMVGMEPPHRMETRSSKRKALGGEASSHPTISVPAVPVPAPEMGDQYAALVAEIRELREMVDYQRMVSWDCRKEIMRLSNTLREEENARRAVCQDLVEQRERMEWLQHMTLEYAHRVHYLENPPPEPAPQAPEDEEPEDAPEEDPEEDPAEDAGNDDDGSDGDGGDVID